MTETNPKPDQFPPQGPISQRLGANSYLQDKKIPQIFESLLAGLMLECPDDHMTYLHRKLDLIKEIGTENIAWDTFVVHLRPDKTHAQEQNTKCDLFHAEQDSLSFDHNESFQQPATYGSSQLFELTDPTLSESHPTLSESKTSGSSHSEGSSEA